MKSAAERLLLPCGILLLFFLLFHGFWDHTINYRDSFLTFAPSKHLVARALENFTVYLWNPHIFLGLPCVAEIHYGWFYPVNLVFLLFDFGLAHRLYILAHYPFAAATMYLFLRGRDLDRGPALLGGLAFALSGYMISQHSIVRMVPGAAWAPLAFYCMDRALRGRVLWAALAGAVMAIQVIAGDPLTALVTASVFAILALGSSIQRGRLVHGLSSVVLAGTSSLLLSAVQVIPTTEILKMTPRTRGLSLGESSTFSFHPARLLEIIWPTPFGAYWPDASYWGYFTINYETVGINHPWSLTLYLGLPLIILFVIGVLSSRHRWKWAVGALALVFLLLALGHHTPVYSWFHAVIPVFNWFRYPAKYMGWFTGFAVVGAALGLERLDELIKERPRLVSRFSLVYAGLSLVIGLFGIEVLKIMLSELSIPTQAGSMYLNALDHCQQTGVHFILINVSTGLLVFLAATRLIAARKALILIIVSMVLDWYSANISTMPQGPPDFYEFRPLAARYINPSGRPALGEFRIYRDKMEFRDTNPELPEYSRFQRQQIWIRNTLKRNLHIMEGFEELVAYGPYQLELGEKLFDNKLSPDVMSLYNVEYVISSFDRKPIKSIPTEVIKRDPLNDISIHRFKNVWPRAYWVPSALRARDEAEAMELLGDTDLKKHAVITSDEPIEAAGPGEASMRPAHMVSYEHDHVAVRTDAEREGWLVLSDRFYPGWQAFVDGERTHIYKANVMVRAVKVPAGRHRVDFHFRPRSVYLGAAISIPAWIGLAFVFVFIFMLESKS